MKISKIIIIGVMAMLLMACSKEEKDSNTGEMSKQELEDLVENTKGDDLPVLSEKENAKKMKEKESAKMEQKSVRNYEVSIWDEAITGIKTPAGVLCRENEILVLDKGNNALVKLDYTSKPLDKVGKLGGSKLEFQSPTGIIEKGKNSYIIDSQNRRIQVLDESLSFVQEIKKIERNTFDGTDFKSIAADSNGNIYLAGNLLMERMIIWKTAEDELQSILPNFYGTVYSTQEGAYALNRGQVFVEPDKRTLGIGYGKNALFSLSNGQAKEISVLPENLGVLTFCVAGDKIYIISHSQQAVMMFDINGTYIETVGKIQDMEMKEQEFYIAVDNNGNVYVARPQKARIDVYR